MKRINYRKQWEQLVTQALPLYKQTNQEDNTRLQFCEDQLYILLLYCTRPSFQVQSQINYLARLV